MGRWAIWRSILGEAWKQTAADLRLKGGAQIMTPVLLFAIYAVFVWFIVGEQHAMAEVRDRLLLIAAPLAIFPLWWVVRVFITIPDREQRSSKRIGVLHTYVRPRLEFELVNGGAPIEFLIGTATSDGGGNIQSNAHAVERIICGVVRNASAKDAHMVAARFSELSGNNENQMRDPVPLYWAPIDGGLRESTVIPANGERTLQLFRVAQRGFYFAHKRLPLEYLHFFERGTAFAGKIVVEEIYHCSLEVHFTLELNGEPRLQIARTSVVENRTAEQWEDELTRLEALDA